MRSFDQMKKRKKESNENNENNQNNNINLLFLNKIFEEQIKRKKFQFTLN
jgi:hypothetical protein